MIFFPSSMSFPSQGSNLQMALIKDDFPQPLGPAIPQNVPRSIRKDENH